MNEFLKGQSEEEGVVEELEGGSLEVAAEEKPGSRSALVIFAVLVIGVGGIYLMRMRSGPAMAEAGAVGDVDQETTKATIDTFLNDGGQSLKAMREMIRDTEKVVGRFKEFPTTAQVPLADLTSNPFRFANAAAGESVDDAASRKKREEERKTVLAKAQALKVQSIVYGDVNKMCMINSNPYREGETVEGLTIEKIRAESVIVRAAGYRFEIKMQR